MSGISNDTPVSTSDLDVGLIGAETPPPTMHLEHGKLGRGASTMFIVEGAETEDQTQNQAAGGRPTDDDDADMGVAYGGTGYSEDWREEVSCADRCHFRTRQCYRCVEASCYGVVALPLGLLTTIPPVLCMICKLGTCQCTCGPWLPNLESESKGGITRDSCAGAPRIFFDGAGWAFNFGLGCAQFLLEKYDVSRCPIFAISAGCFPAICLLLEQDPAEVLRLYFNELLTQMLERPLCGFCDSLGPVRAMLRKWLPMDVHKRASGRLFITISPWPHMGFRLLTNFSSRDEFIDAVRRPSPLSPSLPPLSPLCPLSPLPSGSFLSNFIHESTF